MSMQIHNQQFEQIYFNYKIFIINMDFIPTLLSHTQYLLIGFLSIVILFKALSNDKNHVKVHQSQSKQQLNLQKIPQKNSIVQNQIISQKIADLKQKQVSDEKDLQKKIQIQIIKNPTEYDYLFQKKLNKQQSQRIYVPKLPQQQIEIYQCINRQKLNIPRNYLFNEMQIQFENTQNIKRVEQNKKMGQKSKKVNKKKKRSKKLENLMIKIIKRKKKKQRIDDNKQIKENKQQRIQKMKRVKRILKIRKN